MNANLQIVFAGGGSVGHLMPGLAVAQVLHAALRKRNGGAPIGHDGLGATITFAGSGKPLEERLVREAGFHYVTIASRPLPTNVGQAWQFVKSHIAGRKFAARFLRQQQVAVVVGLGGYASVPMARAAIQQNVPLVLLEQNAIAGKATRWLAPHAEALCLAFSSAQAKLRVRGQVHITGTPVRGEFVAAAQGQSRVAPSATFAPAIKPAPQIAAKPAAQPALDLVVLGGSAGSRVLNESVPRAIYKSARLGCHWNVVHQAGEGATATVRQLYERFGLAATVSAYFDNLPGRLAAAQMAISRAGGTTLAELACAGTPSILVPYEHASDDHQRANAHMFVARRAALLVDPMAGDARFDDRLAAELVRCYRHQALRESLSQQMRGLAHPQAAAQVARLIWQISQRKMLAAA